MGNISRNDGEILIKLLNVIVQIILTEGCVCDSLIIDGKEAMDYSCKELNAIIKQVLEHECYYSYTLNGKHNLGADSRLDIFFAPEKHEGWTHVYKVGDAGYVAGNIYNTKEEALKHPIASKISTVKIEWEE